MLSASEKRRYARQILLAEIGEAGQAQLCRSTLHLGAGGDAGARAVAAGYLERAGVHVTESRELGATEFAVASSAQVATVAGSPWLEVAAAELCGALAAVDAIRHTLGLGTPLATPLPRLGAPR